MRDVPKISCSQNFEVNVVFLNLCLFLLYFLFSWRDLPRPLIQGIGRLANRGKEREPEREPRPQPIPSLTRVILFRKNNSILSSKLRTFKASDNHLQRWLNWVKFSWGHIFTCSRDSIFMTVSLLEKVNLTHSLSFIMPSLHFYSLHVSPPGQSGWLMIIQLTWRSRRGIKIPWKSTTLNIWMGREDS